MEIVSEKVAELYPQSYRRRIKEHIWWRGLKGTAMIMLHLVYFGQVLKFKLCFDSNCTPVADVTVINGMCSTLLSQRSMEF